MNLSTFNHRLDRVEASLPAPDEELRECDQWPPSLSWFADDELEHVQSLIRSVGPRIKRHPDGTINFELITDDELREMSEILEKAQERSR